MNPNDSRLLAQRPAHVPPPLEVDYDLYCIPGAEVDLHAAFHAVQEASPDIFWTPRNGGHWVATRGDDITEMQRDYSHFSHCQVTIPPFPPGQPKIVPLEMDPPLHSQYRRPLVDFLTPSAVAALEPEARQVAVDAIDALVPKGGCEFVRDFANILPIVIFLKIVQIPLTDRASLIALADAGVRGETPQIRVAAQQQMAAYVSNWVRERRANPGDDLLSRVVNVTIDGERINEEEALSYASGILFGGLDTVAGMLSFITLFLARNPDHRQMLVERLDDDAYLQRAVEELIRRHGLANTGRVIARDFTYKDVEFRSGDRIMPANLFVGLDSRLNPNPLAIDFDRDKPRHAAFGNGPHACPGAGLARREIRIFLREWLSRIPKFSIKPGTRPELVVGVVHNVRRLDLVFS